MVTAKSRTGGQLIVDCLLALGADRGFGIPGESYLAILDALYDVSDAFEFVVCRNEGGAAFMAEAYGKLTGKPGLCFVTRGPGACNAAIGVHTARQNSTPMIVLVGQVSTHMRNREAFQEVDYRAAFGSVAKWVVEVEHVDRIPEFVSRAWSTALSGRPGPVVLALPENVLSDLSTRAACRSVNIPEPAPTPAVIDATVAMLKAARRPLMLIGGNAWSGAGRKALLKFVERSNIPVSAVFRCQDKIDNHSPSYVGDAGVGMSPALRKLIKTADVILAINMRFGETATDGYSLLDVPNPKQKLIHCHPSDLEIGKIYAPDIAAHSGPNTFMAALSKKSVTGPWDKWRLEARDGYLATLDVPAQPGPVDMVQVMDVLRNRLGPEAIITNGAGNFAIWPGKFLPFGTDQRLLAPQSGAMGYGLPAAVAAKIVFPERQVVCFAGDGDFQMTCQELGTAKQAGRAPVILILNNRSYGTIRMYQERVYPQRVSATDLDNPDFVALAQAYGFHAERVDATEDFEDAFLRANASKTGGLLDITISEEAISPFQTLSQLRKKAKAPRTVH